MADKSILAMRIELSMADAAQSQLRAQFYQKRIETGVWRDRIGKVCSGSLAEYGGTPLPEADILRDEVDTMGRHISIAEQHLDRAKKLLSSFKN